MLSPAAVPAADGVLRLTIPLPLAIDHVHCYALDEPDGTWTLVDAGVRVADAEAVWSAYLEGIPGPVERVVATHAHVDHMGGIAGVVGLTGASGYAAAEEVARAAAVATGTNDLGRLQRHLLRHGVPSDLVGVMLDELLGIARLMDVPPAVAPVVDGMYVGSWRVVGLPGHADGQIGLLRGGVLVAADAILDPITPTVGSYDDGGIDDPLAAHLSTLDRVAAEAATVVLTGHGRPIDDASRRAAAIRTHHDRRLDAARAAVAAPRTAFEVSQILFPKWLSPTQRRLAVVESLAHLEHLARRSRVRRHHDDDGHVRFVQDA